MKRIFSNVLKLVLLISMVFILLMQPAMAQDRPMDAFSRRTTVLAVDRLMHLERLIAADTTASANYLTVCTKNWPPFRSLGVSEDSTANKHIADSTIFEGRIKGEAAEAWSAWFRIGYIIKPVGVLVGPVTWLPFTPPAAADSIQIRAITTIAAGSDSTYVHAKLKGY